MSVDALECFNRALPYLSLIINDKSEVGYFAGFIKKNYFLDLKKALCVFQVIEQLN